MLLLPQAVATFIAHFVATNPEAMNMPPEKLQKAVSGALRDLKKGRLRRVLSAGHTLYRWTARALLLRYYDDNDHNISE